MDWRPTVSLWENVQAEVSSTVCQQPKHDQAGLFPYLEKVKTMCCFWKRKPDVFTQFFIPYNLYN